MDKKTVLDLDVISNVRLSPNNILLILTHSQPLPQILPGQFAQVRIDRSPNTFLRRPISICHVDHEQNQLWLLVALVGDGTRALSDLRAGDILNCVLPLGKTFSIPQHQEVRVLLVGGGVGVAPMLFLGQVLHESGFNPMFLLGAKTASQLLLLNEFEKYGKVYLTTEDGSLGEKGFVTSHSILGTCLPDMIYCCGPLGMMQAVARYAYRADVQCEVSLENLMACGIGACLCCVEKTIAGNLCACTEGPVFNIKRLLWQN